MGGWRKEMVMGSEYCRLYMFKNTIVKPTNNLKRREKAQGWLRKSNIGEVNLI
jgi:hypothetical protein